MEQFQECHTGKEPVTFLNRSISFSTDIQKTGKHIMTNINGDNNSRILEIITPQIEERLVKD